MRLDPTLVSALTGVVQTALLASIHRVGFGERLLVGGAGVFGACVG